jgi:hypothetical protein
VQDGVRIQTATLIARTSTGSIGEAAAGLLDKENPRRVIPRVVSLGQEGIDLATNEFDQR